MRTDRAGRAIVAGIWGVAVIVMVASAINAVLTYGALGDNRVLGLATGIAVDVALCVALIGDRQMTALGLASRWGRPLRLTTMAMSGVINTAVALLGGHYLMAVLHAFLPVLLVLVTEYGQDVALTTSAHRAANEAAPPEQLPAQTQPVIAENLEIAAPVNQSLSRLSPTAEPHLSAVPAAIPAASARPSAVPPSSARRVTVDDVAPLVHLERSEIADALGTSVATVDRRLRELRKRQAVSA